MSMARIACVFFSIVAGDVVSHRTLHGDRSCAGQQQESNPSVVGSSWIQTRVAFEKFNRTRADAFARWGEAGVERGTSPRLLLLAVDSQRSDRSASSVTYRNDTVPVTSPVRRIQILSTGRSASSFVLSLFGDIGLTTLFEPWNGIIEGSALLHDTNVGRRLACLYECGCTRFRVANSGNMSQAVCDAQHVTLAFKDTRILALDRVATDVPAHVLAETSFVLLLRDPRAVWASVKPFTYWQVHNIPYICKALRMLWDTAAALADKARLLTVFYEYLVTRPETTLAELARSAGFKNTPAEWVGKVHNSSLNNWRDELDATELHNIMDNEDCAAYMQAAGYDAEGEYTALKAPFS